MSLVEVANHDARASEVLTMRHLHAAHPARLVTSLEEAGAEVDIKNVQESPGANIDVSAKDATAFAAAPRDVVIADKPHRVSAERHVAVHAIAQLPVFAELPVIAAQLLGNETCLIFLELAACDAVHLLKRDHVRVQLLHDIDNATREYPPIQATTAVHVISGYADQSWRRNHCWRSKIHPIHSKARSRTGRFFHWS